MKITMTIDTLSSTTVNFNDRQRQAGIALTRTAWNDLGHPHEIKVEITNSAGTKD